MEALKNTTAFFTKPIAEAGKILDKKEPTCGQSILARLCFLAQIISSLIAIPILLVVGLSTAVVRLFEGENVCDAFSAMGKSLRSAVLFSIPVSFVGVFAPLETTGNFARDYEACLIPTS